MRHVDVASAAPAATELGEPNAIICAQNTSIGTGGHGEGCARQRHATGLFQEISPVHFASGGAGLVLVLILFHIVFLSTSQLLRSSENNNTVSEPDGKT